MHDVAAELTPARITETLHAHGHLPEGRVVVVDIHATVEYLHSQHVYVALTYSEEVLSSAPRRMFLKLTKPHSLAAAKREARFYAAIAPRVPGIALVPCYGIGTTPGGRPYLLLADLSLTHEAGRGPLSWAQLEAMVTVLAQLHAASWDQRVMVPLLDQPPEETLDAMFGDAEQHYAELVTNLGQSLTVEQRCLFERYLTAAQALFHARLQSGKPLMLCHPDNIPSNFLFPLQDGNPLYLIDWHVYRWWWGPVDIAALILRSVPPELQSQAARLVQTYYARLQEHGVSGYSWEACWYDYRLGVIDTLRVVLAVRGNPLVALETATLLFGEIDRQDCMELLA